MNKSFLSIILIFCCQFLIAQKLASDIYKELDSFVAAPSPPKMQILSEKAIIFKNHSTTKEDDLALVILQCNIGYYNNTYGKISNSILAYETAWKIFYEQQLSNYDIVENCLIPLGNLYTKQGDFLNAENTIKQYITIAEKENNLVFKNSGIINLSIVYNNLGKYKTAATILTEALKNTSLELVQKKKLQNNLASNLIALQQYEEATTVLNKTLLLRGNFSHFTSYKSLAFIAMKQYKFNQAHSYLDSAKKELAKDSNISARDLAKLYTEEAQLYLQEGNTKNTVESLNKALKTLLPSQNENAIPQEEVLFPENTFITIFDLKASITNNYKEALQYYDLSFYVNSLLIKNIISQETKIIHQAKNKNRSELCLNLLFKAHQNRPDKKHLEQAFMYAENSKSSVLQEAVTKKTLLEQYPNNPLLIEEQRLIQKQENSTNKLIRAQLKLAPEPFINNISIQLNQINIQRKVLSSKIEKDFPKKHTVFSFKNIHKRLQNDKACIVSYFYGKDHIYHFTIDESKVSINRIKNSKETRETIKKFIHLFDNASIINNDIKAYTKTAFKVYKTLQLSTTKPHKNIVIIPDGLLNHIPFGALLTKETKSILFSSMPFMIKKQTLAYNTNVNFYLDSIHHKNKRNDVLGFFPVFKNTSQQLTYSVDEAKSIQDMMEATIFMNQEATKENFINYAHKYSTLHISTHAQSGNFTIPAHIQFHDDMLFLQELYAMQIPSQLVVLSACESGIGKLQRGEGSMNLARGFQYAGANAVLFSLWKINDKSTSQIMEYFYRSYSKSSSAFISNNQSKLDYLNNKKISNAKKSPYYWNTFVYYGTIQKSKSLNKPIVAYLFIGLFISLLIIFIYKFKTKNRYL